jgi:hypothetical protein
MEHNHQPKRRKQVRWQEIHNRLTRRGLPAWLVAAKVEAFRTQMSDRKRQRLFERQHRILWAKLLRPLAYELDSARTGLTYARQNDATNTAKIEAIESYVIVMEELHIRLVDHREDKTHTPSQLAKDYNIEQKRSGKGHPIPNHGVHWTDWVPPHIKERVTNLFQFAPLRPRSKPRLPFKRGMPPSLHAGAALELRKKIQTATDSAQQMHAINPSDATQKRLDQLARAVHILDTMKRSDFVPGTWQALLATHEGIHFGDDELDEEFLAAHRGADELDRD